MKQMVRTFFAVLMVVCLLFSVVPAVNADEPKTILIFSSNVVAAGDTLTVTVSSTADQTITAGSGVITYDSAVLDYTGGAGSSLVSAGRVKFSYSGSGKTLRASITFKVKGGSGSYKIAAVECKINGQSVPGAGASITVKAGANTPSDVSHNADLTSLTVAAGELSPAFSSAVTDYTVVVPYQQTDGVLYVKTADGNAKIAFGGERNLSIGLNTRTVTVTAPDGTQKVYTIVFNRLDENGQDVSKKDAEGPTVTIDGRGYSVCATIDRETAPKSLSVLPYTYEGVEVESLSDASGKMVVLALKDEEGKQKLFRLDGSVLTPFVYVQNGDNLYVVEQLPSISEVPAGYFLTRFTIGENAVDCYRSSGDSAGRFVVLYATPPGQTSAYYRLDTAENTLQQYPDFGREIVATAQEPTVSPSRRTLGIGLLIVGAELLMAILVLGVILIIRRNKRQEEVHGQEDYWIDMDSDDPNE